MSFVWVVQGQTESGDYIEPLVYTKKPSDEQVDDYLMDLYPEEYDAGLTIFWDMQEVRVMD